MAMSFKAFQKVGNENHFFHMVQSAVSQSYIFALYLWGSLLRLAIQEVLGFVVINL